MLNSNSYALYIEADLSDYTGEWVAVVNREIVSHKKDIKEVYKEAKEKYPGKRPLLARVPEEKALIF
ncbi:hypothetical protein IPdc08_01351 [archaeon]|nr:hypothetical protein IPdc08_01351 [archaeon]